LFESPSKKHGKSRSDGGSPKSQKLAARKLSVKSMLSEKARKEQEERAKHGSERRPSGVCSTLSMPELIKDYRDEQIFQLVEAANSAELTKSAKFMTTVPVSKFKSNE